MLSVQERFKLTMNNSFNSNDIDIDILNRELQSEELITDINNYCKEVDSVLYSLNMVESSISSSKDILTILKNNTLSNISIKILSTNKLYTDIWKLNLNDNLVIGIEGALDTAKKGIKFVWYKLINLVKIGYDKFISLLQRYAQRVKKVSEALKGKKLDLSKSKEKIIEVCYPSFVMDAFLTELDKYFDLVEKVYNNQDTYYDEYNEQRAFIFEEISRNEKFTPQMLENLTESDNVSGIQEFVSIFEKMKDDLKKHRNELTNAKIENTNDEESSKRIKTVKTAVESTKSLIKIFQKVILDYLKIANMALKCVVKE